MQNAPVNSRAITLVAVTFFGLVFAVVAGNAVAVGNLKVILIATTASVAIAMALMLGKNYWILIPLTFSAGGSIGALPIPFSYAELGVIGSFGLFVAHLCLKQESIGGKMRTYDLFILVNLAWLISEYVRNPVGLQSFGSDIVGGRPYLSILFTFLGYIVLSNAHLKSKFAESFPAIMAVFMVGPAALVSLSELVPGISKIIYPFYSGVSIEAFRVGPVNAGTEAGLRITSLQEVARPIILILCAYFAPVTLINPLYTGRFILFVIGLLLAGMSGFRSLLLAIGSYMTISTLVRKRFFDLWVLAFASLSGVLIILLAHLGGAEVPFSIQRALSFIPMDWDAAAKRSAEGTSEWRFDMWRDAWEDKNIIKNKLLGDGFGYSMADMLIFSDELRGIGGYVASGNTYESFMIRGSFHNGPLSAIRFGGFIGLILGTILMIGAANYSLKTIVRATQTPYYVLAIFVALPAIYEPIQFFLVIGSYEEIFLSSIFTIGMLNMINLSLDRLAKEDPKFSAEPARSESATGAQST